jgi:hypothetical protein
MKGLSKTNPIYHFRHKPYRFLQFGKIGIFDEMSTSKNQYMKVKFMWSSNMVNKIYSTVNRTTTISDPFPGTYGDWYRDKYGLCGIV